jgi:hypothetical protein
LARWLLWAFPGSFVCCVGILVTLGSLSWRRSHGLRMGRPIREPGSARPGPAAELRPASGWTYVAGASGLAAAGCAIAWIAGGDVARLAVGGAGCLIAVSGFRSRVRALGLRGPDLVVLRAGRPPFVVALEAVTALEPPRTPLGGWTVRAGARRITLMPSDLWGNEDVLDLLAGAIRFDPGGRWWVRGERTRAPPAQRTTMVPFICVGWY